MRSIMGLRLKKGEMNWIVELGFQISEFLWQIIGAWLLPVGTLVIVVLCWMLVVEMMTPEKKGNRK